jgi:phage-related minor tail protein
MTRMSTTSRIVAALAAVAVTAACSDRAEPDTNAATRDAANAAERAGNAVADAAKDAGNAVMDGGRAADAAVETMDVKMALSADTRVDASNINVDTDHVTKTVTLNGRVPSAEQKVVAEDIARAKATGYTVRNALVVTAP